MLLASDWDPVFTSTGSRIVWMCKARAQGGRAGSLGQAYNVLHDVTYHGPRRRREHDRLSVILTLAHTLTLVSIALLLSPASPLPRVGLPFPSQLDMGTVMITTASMGRSQYSDHRGVVDLVASPVFTRTRLCSSSPCQAMSPCKPDPSPAYHYWQVDGLSVATVNATTSVSEFVWLWH